MAIVDRNTFFANLASGTKWSAGVAFTRTNALPLDDKSVFQSLEAAQSYAQSATAYPGQVVTVVESNNTSVYVITAEGQLQDISDASAPLKFVADEASMLALTDIETGQQVLREDTGTIWIFKGGLASNINNWIETASSADTVWDGTSSKVVFKAITEASYQSTDTKDTNTLYFITDSGRICKGNVDVSSDVLIVSVFPEVSTALPRKMYFNSSTLEAKITSNNTDWLVLSPGYISLSDNMNWADADSNKLATIGVIKKAFEKGLADKVDKVIGKVGNIVQFAENGAIKDGGIQIGGATLSANPNSNTVATEAAVKAAAAAATMKWSTIQTS